MCESCGLLTDELAEELAIAYVKAEVLVPAILENIKETAEKANKPENFAFRDSLVIRAQKKFEVMLKKHWERERRIVISNLKKLKKFAVSKASPDDVLFPKKKMQAELTAGSLPILDELSKEYSKIIIEANDFDIPPPTVAARLTAWLKKYVPKFSSDVETISIEKIKRQLIAGIEAGESIPELTKRINDTFETWNKARAAKIARSEALRAANKAALQVYKEAGVKKIVWITWFDDRTCPYCENLDGRVISIEKNFYDLGDVAVAGSGDNRTELPLNYTEIDAPPLHPLCRCSIAAVT